MQFIIGIGIGVIISTVIFIIAFSRFYKWLKDDDLEKEREWNKKFDEDFGKLRRKNQKIRDEVEKWTTGGENGQIKAIWSVQKLMLGIKVMWSTQKLW